MRLFKMWKSRREIWWMNDNWIKDHLDIPDIGVMNFMLPSGLREYFWVFRGEIGF